MWLCGEFRTLNCKLFDSFEISSWMGVILVELRTEWLLMNQLLRVIVLNIFIWVVSSFLQIVLEMLEAHVGAAYENYLPVHPFM